MEQIIFRHLTNANKNKHETFYDENNFMKSMAEKAGPLIEKEIIDNIQKDLEESIKEFLNYMKQFMLENWSDPEVLKQLELQSDAELQPDSIMQFLGSEKAAALTGVTTVGGGGLILSGTSGAGGTAAVVGGIATLSITAGLSLIAAGYFAY